jgi:purine nucleosidase
MPTKIILDCDPGHDDAVAILLAHGSPEVELLAITTVVGNQTLDRVTRNARAIAQIAGIVGVPIAAGADRPLVRAIETAPSVHGETGLDGPVLPDPDYPLDPRHAVDLIIDTVMSHPPKTVTLVPTGGLTNIALAARAEPRIVERVKEVVLMGGAIDGGNWSAVAEFNIIIDPEAADIVFRAGWPLVMVGLDATHEAIATPDVEARIRAIGTAPALFAVDLLGFFRQAYRDAQGFEHPPVHDPCAVAYVIDASIVPTERMPIAVELRGELTLGMTVADRRRPAPPECRTSAAVALDRTRFWDLVVDAIERIGEPRSG